VLKDRKHNLFHHAVREYEITNGLLLSRDKKFNELAEELIDGITDQHSAVRAFEITLEQWYRWLTAPNLSETR
jgi:hypothetical protein